MKTFFSIVLAMVTSLLLIVASFHPRSPEVAAIFPPWWSQAHAFDVASRSGDIVGAGALPSIVLVRGDASDLSSRLHGSGALVTVDARSFITCGTASLDSKR